MDRVEAYRLLTQRMEQFDADTALSTLSHEFSLSEEVWGEAEGVLYTIDLRLEASANGTLTLLGTIQDYNTAKLDMLKVRKSIE